MYVFTYARKNLTRNLGRNILLSIILFAIITLSGISLVIYTGTNQIANEYKEQYGSKVTLLSSLQAEKIPSDTLLSFAASSYLQSYEYTAKVPILSQSLKAIGETGQEAADTPKAWLIASSNKEINEAFKNETKVIVKGTKEISGNQVLISKKLADLNNLDLQDTITLFGKGDTEDKTYEVAGIYDDVSLQGGSQDAMALMNPANEMYTNYEQFLTTSLFKEHGEVSGVFYLKNPDQLPQFQEEIESKGLPSGYRASADQKGYEEMIKPIDSLHHISMMATIGILILGSILVLFLTTFSIRERKYEIGVLRAMGMKKQTVAKTLIYETMMICVITLVLGILCAQIGGSVLGTMLLENQMVLSEQAQMQNILSNIVFGMDPMMILTLIAVTLLLGLCSSFSGLLAIMRFEPSKILVERN